jgi:hypothetical protein
MTNDTTTNARARYACIPHSLISWAWSQPLKADRLKEV